MSRVSVAALAVAFFVVTLAAAACTDGAAATHMHRVAKAAPALLVSPTGSDANTCTQAAPCATLDRAYRAAASGQVVQIAAGRYPYQEIDADAAKTSNAHVVFEPAPGASVYILTLAFGNGTGTPAASHVTVRNIHAGELQAFTPARDLTWINLDAGNFYVRGVQNLLIKGGDWGPCGSRGTPNCGGNSKIDYPQGEQPNDRITIDGALFHDYRIENPSDHFECLFLAGGTNITIRNSRFVNCEFFDIFTQYTGGSFDGLTISGNWFGQPWNGQGAQNRSTAIELSPRGTPYANVLLQRNSFADGTGVTWNDEGRDLTYTNVRAVDNIFGTTPDCYLSVTFQSNLAPDGNVCGAGDAHVPYGYAVGGGRLQVVRAQATRVQRAFALAASGAKLRKITRSTGFSSTTVRAVLANRAYLGGVYGAPGAHPALVSAKRWAAAHKRH
jgi:hypothetical protein